MENLPASPFPEGVGQPQLWLWESHLSGNSGCLGGSGIRCLPWPCTPRITAVIRNPRSGVSKEGAGCVCAAQRTGCKLILETPLGGILVKSQHPAHGWTQGWIQAWPCRGTWPCFSSSPSELAQISVSPLPSNPGFSCSQPLEFPILRSGPVS